MIPTPNRLSLDEALLAARETRALEIGRGAIADVPRVFHEQFGDVPAVIVTDSTLLDKMATIVLQGFEAAGREMVKPFVFPSEGLYAEFGFVAELEAALQAHAAIPVAVGSGTLNDLTKLAAHRVGRPYMCVSTAASMDGYTAFGASITHEGSKQTFDCPAPRAVVADLDVIAAAPSEMTAWGYADLIAKVTAGADWVLAALLGVEPIDSMAWDIVQGGLRDATAEPALSRKGHPEAIGKLVEGLMLGGFAMQSTKSSRPASGAEHQFSHLWDMEHHTHNGLAPSHGLKVGIGTLAVTALYESLLKKSLKELDIDACCAEWPEKDIWVEHARELFDEGDLRTVAVREIAAKYSDVEELRSQLERLRTAWPEITEHMRTQLIPFDVLKSKLQAAGAATEPEQIGISRERLRDSFRKAFFIRRRFTVLDVAVRTRLLDRCVAEIFGPDGIWPIES